ncbi:MAG: hypothetical protein ACI92Z_003830 [Paracoccaceae bacterium]|jgi:hypothetical protein
MERDDPFEKNEILNEIDHGLQKSDVSDRLAEAGFGASSKLTANHVMSRLRARNLPPVRTEIGNELFP